MEAFYSGLALSRRLRFSFELQNTTLTHDLSCRNLVVFSSLWFRLFKYCLLPLTLNMDDSTRVTNPRTVILTLTKLLEVFIYVWSLFILCLPHFRA